MHQRLPGRATQVKRSGVYKEAATEGEGEHRVESTPQAEVLLASWAKDLMLQRGCLIIDVI
jgi:hypothetical protein